MGKIYTGQSAVLIQMTVGVAIIGSICSVKYRKPSGTTGFWVGTITDADNGIFTAIPESTEDIDQAGTWTFWANVMFADGSVGIGVPVQQVIYEAGYVAR